MEIVKLSMYPSKFNFSDLKFTIIPIGLYSSSQVFSWITILLLLSELLHIKFSEEKIVYNKRANLLMTFFFLLVAGLFFDILNTESSIDNKHLIRSLKFIERGLPFIAFPLLFSFRPIASYQIRLAQKAFLYITLLIALICLCHGIYKQIVEPDRIISNWDFYSTQEFYEQYPIDPINWGYFVYRELSSTVGFHPIYLSIYCILALLISLEELRSSNLSIKKWRLIIFIIILVFFVFLLGGRMPLIILFVIVFYQLFLLRRFKKKIIFITLATLLLISALLFLLKPLTFRLLNEYNRIENSLSRPTGNNRVYYWRTAIKLIKDQPFLGYGLSGARNNLQRSYNNDGFNQYFNTHNQFLMITLESGVVGFIIFTGLLVYKFFISFKHQRSDYTLFLIIVVLLMLTENIFDRHKGILIFALFNTLYYLEIRNPKFYKIRSSR
ncbi:MAG: O-antigen ligase family protein [Bacteroidota bacterium]